MVNIKEILVQELIKSRAKTPDDLAMVKRKVAKKYKIPCPTNIDLLKTYRAMVRGKKVKYSKKIESLLRTRPIRSLSGIVNVSVLTKPYPCPGKCLYCPIQKGVPKSYLDNEPAVMRAILNKYNPYRQVKMRLQALKNTGHPTDKIELRVIGGTWSFYPKKYQTWFIKKCFDACNSTNYTMVNSLLSTQRLNEKAKHRIIGLSIETRPDFINKEEVKRLRKFGVTRVELGVQTIYNDVLKLNKRGHDVETTIRATKLLKDAGFKICYQIMPNLPGSSLKRDKKMFEELFANPDFQPDLLKIYPCALLKEAPLYKQWKAGRYRPYTKNQLINLIKSIKKKIPYYVRIQRISRDIPSQSIVAGPAKISNLRQILAAQSRTEGWRCQCIRCREVRENYNPKEKLYLFRQGYDASDGKEIFLTFCARGASASGGEKPQGRLYSLLRLRITSQNTAIIRDVHTYGQLQSLSPPAPPGRGWPRSAKLSGPQHKGLGKKLIKEAEKITKKEFDLNKISVISGIGVRNYYRKKLGYKLKDGYMVKELKSRL